jgi:hypothetical protein
VRPSPTKPVASLLDAMKEGHEYVSIIGLTMNAPDLVPGIRRGIAALERIRNRRCICYVANVVQDVGNTSIVAADHLPFSEAVTSMPADVKDVDVLLATPGGSGEQVTHFVDALRSRFETVEFLIPYKAMSAGTLWALSGDRIWMDRRAFLGPIDPQVPAKDGRFVPAQSLLTLVDKIKREGQEAIRKGEQPDWTSVQIIRNIDYRQLGAAINGSEYSIGIAQRFLSEYKFKGWTKHSSSGVTVTDEDRRQRADTVARALCSNERWKIHGHALTRDVIGSELRIQIDQPESVQGLEGALRRLWALFSYVLDKSATAKLILSQEVSLVRTGAQIVPVLQ